jgi:hypothetical protein
LATAGPTSSKPYWFYAVILGAGVGACLSALVTVAQLTTPKELISITSGLLIAMRSFGGSIGLAICTLFSSLLYMHVQELLLTLNSSLDNAIFTNKLTNNLGKKIAAAVLPLGLPASSLPAFITDLANSDSTDLVTIPGVTGEIIGAGVGALKEAYTIAFRYVWIAAGCFTVVAAIGKSPYHSVTFYTQTYIPSTILF